MKFGLLFVLGLVFGVAVASPALDSTRIEGDKDCGQNDVDGLGPFADEFFEIFPLTGVVAVLLEYAADDEEVISVLEYMSSDDFIYILTYLNHSQDFLEIMEYFCTELSLDLYFYLNFIGQLFGHPVITRPPWAIETKLERVPGVQGMLDAMLELVPSEELEAFWNENYANNTYVQRAVDKLRSPQMERVFDSLTEMPEWEDAKDRLEGLGFDVVSIIDSIKRWLGFIE